MSFVAQLIGHLITAILLLLATTVRAEPELVPVHSPRSSISFSPVVALKQHPSGAVQIQARHASPANTNDWQASLYTSFVDSDGKVYPCTAALVGPDALLTAAHCVPDDPKYLVTMSRMPFEPTGAPHNLTCQRSDTFNSDQSTDWALCAIEPKIASPAAFKFERIELIPLSDFMQQPHLSLMLGGYGCTSDFTSDDGGTPGKKFGYNIGVNSVIETSATQPPRTYEDQLYTTSENANLFTDPWGGTNLCPGDSGGPAFRINGPVARPYSDRVIVAINIAVFWTSPAHVEWGGSTLAALGAGGFGAWARKWAEGKHIVCGIWPDVPPGDCR